MNRTMTTSEIKEKIWQREEEGREEDQLAQRIRKDGRQFEGGKRREASSRREVQMELHSFSCSPFLPTQGWRDEGTYDGVWCRPTTQEKEERLGVVGQGARSLAFRSELCLAKKTED